MTSKIPARRWQVFDLNASGLSAVAFSGSYNDLSGKPSIPAAQQNSDWSASVGVTAILNKPTLFSGAYADLTGKPTIPAAQVNSDWSASTGVAVILNKPTIPAAQVQSDWNATTGLGVILNKPTIPKVAWYTVTTNASGVWTASISGFTTVSYVSCFALNTAATAAGARIATLTSFNTSTATGTVCLANSITSILGLLGLGLSGAGVTVYVRVEGT